MDYFKREFHSGRISSGYVEFIFGHEANRTDTSYYVNYGDDDVVVKDGRKHVSISLEAMKAEILDSIKHNEKILNVLYSIIKDIDIGLNPEMLLKKYPHVPLDWIYMPRQEMKRPTRDLEFERMDFIAIQLLIDERDKS
jgi:hypothetical protein